MSYQNGCVNEQKAVHNSRADEYRRLFTPMMPSRSDTADFDTTDYKFRNRPERYSSGYAVGSVLQ